MFSHALMKSFKVFILKTYSSQEADLEEKTDSLELSASLYTLK